MVEAVLGPAGCWTTDLGADSYGEVVAVASGDRRSRRPLADELLFAPDRHRARLVAQRRGLDPDARRLVAALRSDAVDARIVLAVATAAIDGGPTPMGTVHGAHALVVLDAEQTWLELRRELGAALGSCAIALSPWQRTVEALDRAATGAMEANARQRPSPAVPLVRAEEPDLVHLLANADAADLSQFIERWLGTLIAYDRDHQTSLFPTLALYLTTGGALDRTAEGLGIHRSTLKYRLGRIRELTGNDLADPETRFNLHFAARALGVVDRPSTQVPPLAV